MYYGLAARSATQKVKQWLAKDFELFLKSKLEKQLKTSEKALKVDKKDALIKGGGGGEIECNFWKKASNDWKMKHDFVGDISGKMSIRKIPS